MFAVDKLRRSLASIIAELYWLNWNVMGSRVRWGRRQQQSSFETLSLLKLSIYVAGKTTKRLYSDLPLVRPSESGSHIQLWRSEAPQPSSFYLVWEDKFLLCSFLSEDHIMHLQRKSSRAAAETCCQWEISESWGTFHRIKYITFSLWWTLSRQNNP